VSRAPSNPASGIILVDKPAGLTSHDVVARARRLIGTRKVGHAGTLDPMATGLLVLGANSSTRLLTYLVGLDKEYTATIRLGAASTTDDAEGELLPTHDVTAVTDDAIAAGVAALRGDIMQRPSSVSAIKVDGKRAYTLAREGEDVVLAERSVTIRAFDVLGIERGEWIDVGVRVECSSGTYIRALARDLGENLGVGGHLTVLRRTRVGPFSVEQAVPIDESMPERLIPPAVAATALFPRLDLDDAQASELANGKRIAITASAAGPLAAIAPDGTLVGLVEAVDGRARVLANFPPDSVSA
jgi:tRNA pseudouridine55 synthase